ncbi:MAG: hypothetical protein MK052_11550 [Alphaproteobacteria bacterium]|nr:hypothetical protein [Alphaproteobacteria bacterium]
MSFFSRFAEVTKDLASGAHGFAKGLLSGTTVGNSIGSLVGIAVGVGVGLASGGLIPAITLGVGLGAACGIAGGALIGSINGAAKSGHKMSGRHVFSDLEARQMEDSESKAPDISHKMSKEKDTPGEKVTPPSPREHTETVKSKAPITEEISFQDRVAQQSQDELSPSPAR